VGNFRSLAELGSSRSAERGRDLVSLARRPRLGPDRVAHAPGGLLCRPSSRRPRTSGHGRLGITADHRCYSGGRPRLGRTPVRDEVVPSGCHATGCGCRRSHANSQDQRNRYMSPIFAADVTILAITGRSWSRSLSNRLSSWSPSQAQRDHSQSRGTRQQRARPEQACPRVGDGRQRTPVGR
jgi:hypothetical protein